RVHGLRAERLELRVRERVGALHQARDGEVPPCFVEARHAPEMQDRPRLHQALARRHARRDLGRVLVPEQAHRVPAPASSATLRQTVIASSTSWALTPRWVTRRSLTDTTFDSTPASSSR